MFDLAQLNTETAKLHLKISAAQELDQSISTPAHQVASAIQALPIVEGSMDKAIRGKLRPVEVSLGQSAPANVEFSSNPQRNRLTQRVEHIERCILNRATDRYAAAASLHNSQCR